MERGVGGKSRGGGIKGGERASEAEGIRVTTRQSNGRREEVSFRLPAIHLEPCSRQLLTFELLLCLPRPAIVQTEKRRYVGAAAVAKVS